MICLHWVRIHKKKIINRSINLLFHKRKINKNKRSTKEVIVTVLKGYRFLVLSPLLNSTARDKRVNSQDKHFHLPSQVGDREDPFT